ncbi:MAG: hypothetical protein ABW060_18265 [Solirubrobacteraceae bacterium]
MTTNRITLPLAAAFGFAATGALELAHEQAQPFAAAADYAIEGAFLLALATAAAALWQRRRGRATAVAAGGHAALALCAAATFARGADALGPLFPLGLLAILGGLLAATVTRGAPRREPAILLAGWVVTLAAGTPLVLAAAWVAVAALGARRLAPAVAPA